MAVRQVRRGGFSLLTIGIAALALVASCTASTAGSGTAASPTSGDAAASAPITAVSDVDETASTDPVTAPPDPAAAPADLIAEALADGEIDEGTALLYRTWAAFGDRGLPSQFQGGGELADPALFAQLVDVMDELPGDIADAIRPYLLRPSDRESAFSAVPDGIRGAGLATHPAATSPAATSPAAGEIGDAVTMSTCANGWASRAEQGDDPVIRVWICKDYGDDAAVDRGLDRVLGFVEATSGDIYHSMGRPLPDDPFVDPANPADDLIDIYVLPSGWLTPYRAGGSSQLMDFSPYQAVPTSPYRGVAASAYGMLPQEILDDGLNWSTPVTQLMFTFAQYGRNVNLMQRSHWLYRATEYWAGSYFAPGGIVRNSHVSTAQTSELSVASEETRIPFAAVWFKFLQQEAGAQAVFDIWHDLAGRPTGAGPAEVIDALTRQIDVVGSFPQFALRLLNADLPGNPISPRFVEVDPSVADNTLPNVPLRTLSATTEISADDLPHLGVRFAHFEIPNPERMPIPWVVGGRITGGAPSVQAVWEDANGSYVAQDVNIEGDELCIGGTDLWIIVANGSTAPRSRLTGGITLTRNDATAECGTDLRATPTPSPADRPPAPPTGTRGEEAAPRDYCADLNSFRLQIAGITDLALLPYTAQRVAEIFSIIEPYRSVLPDGAPESLDRLHDYLARGADKSAAEAADILDNDEVRRLAGIIDFPYSQHCEG